VNAVTLLDLFLEAAAERAALRAQLEYAIEAWQRAEAAADHWYFAANNPEEVREQRAEFLRWAASLGGEPLTVEVMEERARALRVEIDERWAAEAAGRKAS
jgi:hypothetical protein